MRLVLSGVQHSSTKPVPKTHRTPSWSLRNKVAPPYLIQRQKDRQYQRTNKIGPSDEIVVDPRGRCCHGEYHDVDGSSGFQEGRVLLLLFSMFSKKRREKHLSSRGVLGFERRSSVLKKHPMFRAFKPAVLLEPSHQSLAALVSRVVRASAGSSCTSVVLGVKRITSSVAFLPTGPRQ